MAGAKKRAAMKDVSEGGKALAAGGMPAEVAAILQVNLPIQLVPRTMGRHLPALLLMSSSPKLLAPPLDNNFLKGLGGLREAGGVL